MPSANPLEQLRRRMLSHATPAAFAALAEEHRRAGRLAEAIAVCRDGLERYQTYVSARVTLGRALLDSGQVAEAVAELDQAVAQAPDNLAAVRALDAARAALAELPPSSSDEPADLDLQPIDPADDILAAYAREASDPEPAWDAPSSEASVTAEAPAVLAAGPDSPQEFGLGPGWTVPEAEAPDRHEDDLVSATTESAWSDIDAPTQDVTAHADAPTICLTPRPLQGDEPAGVWPVPVPTVADDPGDTAEGAPVYSWAIAPPDAAVDDDRAAQGAPGMAVPAASVWDEPTIEAPVVDAQGIPALDASADPAAGGSTEAGFWGGLFVEPVSDGAAPTTFAGWDEPGPSAPGLPTWAVETPPAENAGMWDGAPADGPAADTAHAGAPEATRDDAEPGPAEPLETAPRDDAPQMAEICVSVEQSPIDDQPLVDAAPVDRGPVGESHWAGSVASALDEVFARAGQSESLEPPTHTSPVAREAMADAAVAAAMEDTALAQDTLSPALVSLQQMLDAVRARRAALFGDVNS